MADRKDPIPPSLRESITHSEAEEAQRHLSWTPDERVDLSSGTQAKDSGEPEMNGVFWSYVGAPDGTFEVRVVIQHEGVVADQVERGSGERQSHVAAAANLAYEKADRALSVLREEQER